jgi:hypothetical protein
MLFPLSLTTCSLQHSFLRYSQVHFPHCKYSGFKWIQKSRQNYIFMCINLCAFREQAERQKILNQTVTSVDKKPTRCHFCCYPLFLFYKLLNMFKATMCPSTGADDCVVLSPLVGIVPWLQEGCQNWLAGSVAIEEFVAMNSSVYTLPANRF